MEKDFVLLHYKWGFACLYFLNGISQMFLCFVSTHKNKWVVLCLGISRGVVHTYIDLPCVSSCTLIIYLVQIIAVEAWASLIS